MRSYFDVYLTHMPIFAGLGMAVRGYFDVYLTHMLILASVI